LLKKYSLIAAKSTTAGTPVKSYKATLDAILLFKNFVNFFFKKIKKKKIYVWMGILNLFQKFLSNLKWFQHQILIDFLRLINLDFLIKFLKRYF